MKEARHHVVPPFFLKITKGNYSSSNTNCRMRIPEKKDRQEKKVSAVRNHLSMAEPQREKRCDDYEQNSFHRLNCDRQKLRTSGLQIIGNSSP